MFRLKNTGRKDDFKIIAIVAKRKFDSESYDSFIEKETFLNVWRNLTNKKEFV